MEYECVLMSLLSFSPKGVRHLDSELEQHAGQEYSTECDDSSVYQSHSKKNKTIKNIYVEKMDFLFKSCQNGSGEEK